MLPPEATVAGPQLSVWVGAVPVIEQLSAGVLESIDQSTPVPPGSGSEMETPVASPAPVLVSVTVNPMSSPALTEAASAVLVIVRLGQFTVIVAVAELSVWSDPSLSAATVAVFESVPQSWASVTPETWIVFDTPSSSVANVQLRVPDEIEHPVTAGSIDQATPAGNGALSVTLVAVPGRLFVT